MFREIHFNSIDSTHKWALRSVPHNEPIVISCDFQTDGIGRKNDPWLSPKGENLLLTFLFPYSGAYPPHNLAQIVAHSILSQLIRDQIEVKFKWPNDLMFNKKKLVGTMVDIKNGFAIASSGINVNTSPENLKNIDQPATSLKEIKGKEIDLTSLKKEIIKQFSADLDTFIKKGFTPFYAPLQKHLLYKHKTVQIGDKKGVLKRLSIDGRVALEIDGKELLIGSGSLKAPLN